MIEEKSFPEDTEWLAKVNVDHGKYFTVEDRYIPAAKRTEAIQKAMANLRKNEHLNGVSLIPAKDYLKLNS